MGSIGERLRQERERLGLNQTQLAELAGTTRKSQFNYETDVRRPDADYLAAIAAGGADVFYVLTGEREGPPRLVLSAEEQTMLDYFRDASKEVRRAALGALLGASTPVGKEPAPRTAAAPGAAMAARKRSSSTSTGEQVFRSQVGQAVKVSGNLDQTGISFFSNKKDKK